MRSHAGRRDRAVLAMVVLVTAALIVPVADGIAAATDVSAVPAKLVGKWSRTVTSGDLTRAEEPGLQTGVYSVVIKKDGSFAADVRGGISPDFTGKLAATAAGRLTIEYSICSGFTRPNVYRWRVAGSLLTITKVLDKCGFRKAIFPGVWKRK